MTTLKEMMMEDAPASVETTYTIAVGDGFEGRLEGRTDQDWVRVELVAGKSYDIRLMGIGSERIENTYLRVFNAAGEEVAFNNKVDSADLYLSSMVEFSPDTGGVYYLSAGIHPYTTLNTIGDYRMTITDEEDDSTGTPHTVSPNGRFNGMLYDKFDEDWIRVELVEGKTYTITLAGVWPDADTDTVLRLYDAAGEQVAFNDDVDYAAGKVNSLVTFTPAVTGTYYIGAGAYRGNPSLDNSGHYLVTVYDQEVTAGFTLTGTEESDNRHNELVGGPGDDVLDGGAGYDWLEGGAGADVIRGGPGGGMARYRYSDAGVEVNLEEGTARGGHAEGDTFPGEGELAAMTRASDTRDLFGSAYDDILTGNRVGNTLFGYYGDDELDGGDGDDELIGGPGADVLRGGDGIDWVSYFTSDAAVEVRLHDGTARGGDAEGDTFPGTMMVEYTNSDGNTQIVEVPDIERVGGSHHDDVLVGAHGGNLLVGDFGDDVLDGREGDDRLYGEGGNDELHGGEGHDLLVADYGDDVLHGGEGDDELHGQDGADELHGGEGGDLLVAGDGDDVLHGGAGDDELYGQDGADELHGGEGGDLLVAGDGDDVLHGGAGDDELYGQKGADAFWGDGGIDVVTYRFSDAGVEVHLHYGGARGGDAEGDTFPGRKIIEYIDSTGVVQTAAVSDVEFLEGSNHDDILIGDRGDNRLDGLAGNDELDGREGDDFLAGEAGADIIRGGDGADIASYHTSNAGVEVRLYDGTARGGDAEGDTFPVMQTIDYVDTDGVTREVEVTDIEGLYGSGFDDILAGNLGGNPLAGLAGNDELHGREGDDILWGGMGDDELYGGGGDDELYGGGGDDALVGGAGADTLMGGPDDDRLVGGAGDDTFIFAPGGGDDIIEDLGAGGDKIDLTAFEEIRSIADLVVVQDGSHLDIDLPGHDGGTVTLLNTDEADLMDEFFIFFIDNAAAMA